MTSTWNICLETPTSPTVSFKELPAEQTPPRQCHAPELASEGKSQGSQQENKTGVRLLVEINFVTDSHGTLQKVTKQLAVGDQAGQVEQDF